MRTDVFPERTRERKNEIEMTHHAKRGRSGQATVEFALASLVFLLFVFGTIDFGRAIFISAELHNAAREGSRYGAVHPTDTSGIKAKVVAKAIGSGVSSSGVSASCSGGCTTGGTLTVGVAVGFQAVTQTLLHLPALTLHASSTAEIE